MYVNTLFYVLTNYQLQYSYISWLSEAVFF